MDIIMQVFLIGTVIETARALDKRRLNKQIVETKQILKALSGESTSWANHPVVKMYKHHTDWLKVYQACLEAYQGGRIDDAELISMEAENIRPIFTYDHAFLENMKKRLYTKDNTHYSQWAELGKSLTNMYYVENTWLYYDQSK